MVHAPIALSAASTAEVAVTVRRTRRKDARPGDLLQAALDLFVEKGFAATRVEQVAARAGVSKGTLFLYYRSKEELLKAVVRENISGRYAHWRDLIERHTGSTAELIAEAVQDWWQRIGQTNASGIGKLMLCEGQNFPELARFYRREVIEPGSQLVGHILRRGVVRGEFRAELDVDYAVYALLAPLLQLTLMRHSEGACSDPAMLSHPERYLAAQLDVMLHGVLTHPPTEPPRGPTQPSTRKSTR